MASRPSDRLIHGNRYKCSLDYASTEKWCKSEELAKARAIGLVSFSRATRVVIYAAERLYFNKEGEKSGVNADSFGK